MNKELINAEIVTVTEGMFGKRRWYRLEYVENGQRKTTIQYGNDYHEACRKENIELP